MELARISSYSPAEYTEAEFRAAIGQVEEDLKALPQLDLVLRHTFAGGVYVREMDMPAGVTVTSRIHKKDHAVSLLRGSCFVIDQLGAYVIHAPLVFYTAKGTKRLIYALKDLTWANSVAVKATTPEEALDEMTCITWEEWDRENGLIPLPPPD